MSNSFGKLFKFTSFGESHGRAVGTVIENFPAGVKIDLDFIQHEVNRRKTGLNKYTTKRQEDDRIEIISGVFENYSTGHPICVVVKNSDANSKSYENIKNIYRPSHADYVYDQKYGIRDYRGGGRSSARETLNRSIAGAFAKLILNKLGIEVMSGIYSIGNKIADNIDFKNALISDIFSLDAVVEKEQKELINKVRENGDSIGGTALVKIKNLPVGLGEPVYYKLDAILANAMVSINAVKGVEFGLGFNSSIMNGSIYNDEMNSEGFFSNNSGGILGGISNGEDIDIKIHFKPTPSISKVQKSIDKHNNNVEINIKGRHDPCVAIRGSVICESMASIVILDMLLLNMSSNISNIKKIYN